MKVDEYRVLEEAVARGITYAINRAEEKMFHEDELNDGRLPHRQEFYKELLREITNEICEWFSFEEVEVNED